MKSIFKKLQLAIKSRREYNKTLTTLQKKRLSVCGKCPHNSDNKEYLTVLDRLKLLMNNIFNAIMGIYIEEEAVCTLCGCNLIFKSSQEDPSNFCDEGKWDNL